MTGKTLQAYLFRVITTDEPGLINFLVRLILNLLEFIYLLLLKLTFRFTRRNKLPVPVISVGNITAGGTGKTPTVIWLVEMIQQKGFTPAILTRGYGGNLQDVGVCFKSSIQKGLSPIDIGDEPFLLSKLLPETPIVVGRERYRNGLKALHVFPEIDLFILDDGFQHWNLFRELDIVMLDATKPFSNRHLLPRGFLREPLSSLKRAEIILLTRAKKIADNVLSDLKSDIIKVNPQVLVDVVEEKTSYLIPLGSDLKGQMLAAAEFLAGRKVAAITAIGNPRQFLGSLEQMGAEVGYFKAYKDHYRWEKEEIIELSKVLAENGFSELIITAKDGVKLEPYIDYFRKNALDCYVLSLDYQVGDPAIIQKITDIAKKRNKK